MGFFKNSKLICGEIAYLAGQSGDLFLKGFLEKDEDKVGNSETLQKGLQENPHYEEAVSAPSC